MFKLIKKFKGFTQLVLITTLLSPAALAQDLLLPGSTEKIRDQGWTGTCYAHAASELLDAWYAERLRPSLTAPYVVAFYYNRLIELETISAKEIYSPMDNASARFLDGGVVDYAIKATLKPLPGAATAVGMCREEKFPISESTFSNLFIYTALVQPIINDLVTIRKNGDRKLTSAAARLKIEEIFNRLRDTVVNGDMSQCRAWCKTKMLSLGMSGDDCWQLCHDLKTYFTSTNSGPDGFDMAKVDRWVKLVIDHPSSMRETYNYHGAIKKYVKNNAWNSEPVFSRRRILSTAHEAVIREECKPFLAPDPGSPQYFPQLFYTGSATYPSDRAWGKKLESFLDWSLKYRQPVAIGIVTEGLIEPAGAPNLGLHGFHAVVVIGRTKINGEKYYIVKNSWGPGWLPETKGILAKRVMKNGKPVGGLFALPASTLDDIVKIREEETPTRGSKSYNSARIDSADSLSKIYFKSDEYGGRGDGGPNTPTRTGANPTNDVGSELGKEY
ncbi:hypothetical protein JNK13_04660 [bacterium]|nr:hypothetical protein [bacterium]